MATKTAPTTDALEILHRRYYERKSERLASLEEERLNAKIARAIYGLRAAAGLSQRKLAELVGTQASVICRLEDSDCRGHSLSMLPRSATALQKGRSSVRPHDCGRRPPSGQQEEGLVAQDEGPRVILMAAGPRGSDTCSLPSSPSPTGEDPPCRSAEDERPSVAGSEDRLGAGPSSGLRRTPSGVDPLLSILPLEVRHA